MANPGFKSELFEQFARVGKALSHANRLEILEFLAQAECSVETLASKCRLSIANTSQHLQQLKQAGLVLARKEGLNVFYRLSGEDVVPLLDSLRQVAERHIGEVSELVSTYLDTRDSLEPLPAGQLLQRARDGLVTVLDVRPLDEYTAGHLPGAINIPLSELESRLAQLDPSHEIIAYCRGPHCVLAFDAVKRLRELGRTARRLEHGFPEWKAAGYPVE